MSDTARLSTASSDIALSDAEVAALLAERAGRRLLDLRARMSGVGTPAGDLRDAGDAGSQQVLADLLAEHRPHDGVLSEEDVDDAARLTADRVWIIDPLDGTREYAEGRADWAVHVALWQEGALVAGAVALPARGIVYRTDEPAPVLSAADATLRLAVSRTRPPGFVHDVADLLGAVLVPMGSAGVKATSVLRDETDAYLHAGGQYEWDSAAPVAVAAAAGLHTSRVDGSALVYNRPDPSLPDLLVCRVEHARTLLDAVAHVTGRAAENEGAR